MLFKWLKVKATQKRAAKSLYQVALSQSRQTAFYKHAGISDTMDGRFDLLSFHIVLMMNRLKAFGEEGTKLSQALFDVMFRETEFALRESGVGDLGVPKHMAKMMQAFNGRVNAYYQAIEADDLAAFESVIAKNIYRSDIVLPQVQALALYGFDASNHFSGYSLQDFVEGRVEFHAFSMFEDEGEEETAYAQAI